jgi:hypothetical protein
MHATEAAARVKKFKRQTRSGVSWQGYSFQQSLTSPKNCSGFGRGSVFSFVKA